MIHFVIPEIPVAKGRPRVGRWGGMFTPSKTREAQKRYSRHISRYCPDTALVGPIRLEVLFYIPIPKTKKAQVPLVGRSDIDNYLKLLMDSITDTAGMWEDDAQVVEVEARKMYSTNPRIEVSILDFTSGGNYVNNDNP